MWAILTDPRYKNGSWPEEEFFQHGREEIQKAIHMAGESGYPKRFNTALDFGCGIGRLTQALADHFQAVAGVDIAESMIEQANQYNRHGERVTYFLNQKNSLGDFPDQSFNFIYSSLVLQHMHPSISLHYLIDFARLLTSGGIMIIQAPDCRAHSLRGEGEVPVQPHLPVPQGEEARMEVYGIPRIVVEGVCKSAGVRPLWTRPNNWCGEDWVSWLYAFVKY